MKVKTGAEKIWVSVDGGGTKTQVCAGGASGQILFDETFGGINYKSSGVENVKAVLGAAVRKMMSATGSGLDGIMGMVMGISGCDTREDLDLYYSLMEQLGIRKPGLYICNDTEFTFRALSSGTGISMVGGTGSIACAFRDGSLIGRTGGWGAPLSDEGSGYWIGAHVLRRLIRWLDGTQTEYAPVFERILASLETPEKEAAAAIATMGASRVASFSTLIFDEARLGDSLCGETIGMARDHLLRLYVTLAKRCAFDPGFDLVAAGGLFSDSGFRESFFRQAADALPASKVNFIYSELAPAVAGLAYVRKRYSPQGPGLATQ